jgi:hypothetical protein
MLLEVIDDMGFGGNNPHNSIKKYTSTIQLPFEILGLVQV